MTGLCPVPPDGRGPCRKPAACGRELACGRDGCLVPGERCGGCGHQMVAHAASTAVAVSAVKAVVARARRASGRPASVAPPAGRAPLCWLVLLLVLLAGCCGLDRELLATTRSAVRAWASCSQPAGVSSETWARTYRAVEGALEELGR